MGTPRTSGSSSGNGDRGGASGKKMKGGCSSTGCGVRRDSSRRWLAAPRARQCAVSGTDKPHGSTRRRTTMEALSALPMSSATANRSFCRCDFAVRRNAGGGFEDCALCMRSSILRNASGTAARRRTQCMTSCDPDRDAEVVVLVKAAGIERRCT